MLLAASGNALVKLDAERFKADVKRRYQDIVKDYPGTPAAADAQAILDGKEPTERSMASEPSLATLEQEELASIPEPAPTESPEEPTQARAIADTSTQAPKPTEAAPQSDGSVGQGTTSGTSNPVVGTSPKTVHVNGYTRKDGKYVAPYTRATPGSGHKR
jgi:hypothetical protein